MECPFGPHIPPHHPDDCDYARMAHAPSMFPAHALRAALEELLVYRIADRAEREEQDDILRLIDQGV